MKRKLQLLVALQDLDIMIRETADPDSVKEEKKLGFEVKGLDKLMVAREKLASQVDPELLKLYERVSKRYGRGVVPVEEGVCLGCFMSLPTARAPRAKEITEIVLCENCGRILYWV
ncbi:MAG: C4-type zinc ribbon domain-containing protein [Candidatus Eisenbacteria bacterium]|nr:C4-type zinc ribbon domain-containing protein [Candidatus Eisenbacteria bacterium]